MRDAIDRALINIYQSGIPLSQRPFEDMGAAVGCDEQDAIARIKRMLEGGALTRVGPLYNVEMMGGAYCLCAMRVPEPRWDDTVAAIDALPEVAHNYARDHALNMWFVVATETIEQIDGVVGRIETVTGLDVFCFPKQREFFVDFKVKA